MNTRKKITAVLWSLLVTTNVSAFAQVDDKFINIAGRGGQKLPKSLLTIVTVNLEDVAFEEALAVIAE
ncbi:MAG: hypothetical protein ACE5IW_13675, partial [bacterium]